jgi:hypothetical protein
MLPLRDTDDGGGGGWPDVDDGIYTFIPYFAPSRCRLKLHNRWMMMIKQMLPASKAHGQ